MRHSVKTTFSRTEIPRGFACHIRSVLLTDKWLTVLQNSECFLSNGTKYVHILFSGPEWEAFYFGNARLSKTVKSCTDPLEVKMVSPFTLRVVIKGRAYPNGVGNTKKEAKQNAAKHALTGMMETTEQKDEHALTGMMETTEQKDEHALTGMMKTTEQKDEVKTTVSYPPSPAPGPPVRAVISQPNYVCWLNEHSQKNKLSLKALEGTRVGPNNTSQCCRYVVGEKEYPEGFGNTKKEAKEDAALQVYLKLWDSSQTTGTVDENCNGTTGKHKEELNQKVVVLCEKVEHMNMSPEQNVPERYSFITTEETNFIGILNHYCQKINRFLDFKLEDKRGPSHDPEFVYKVLIDQREYPDGLGKTAKEAKQQAAQLAWSALQEQSDWNSQVGIYRHQESQDATPSSQDIAGNTSDSIIFADNVSSPKVQILLLLAPNFKMPPVKTKQEGPNLKGNYLGTLSSGRTSNQQVISRFLSEFDSIEKIGKGGFGHVYKARRKLEQKYFAVKIVRSKGKAKREVGALAGLQHPNIVRYYTAWLEDTAYRCDTTSESVYFCFKVELFKNHCSKRFNISISVMSNVCQQRNKTSYDRKVDIFALGLIYFELLWNLSGMEKAEVTIADNTVIEWMLFANPEERPDARQLKTKLNECSLVLTRDNNVHQDNRTI
uniref:Eukaryotic translation initiation factor 2-alpha kinase 2 n=1 Tax=Hucho hucho TaxID=62062 RepID=A0A4W5JSW6_9TELE